ncbi:cyclopropane fatty acyl phospholipid synthase [archaeon]|jgi:cyclopropane-fatty-acyl-phospholipid synthase|nr:cyclopropane fatty acyl phospholipid synthase [archaeon]MBT4397147.1 cyclopropane fatty acyl phospholipid synthase [archaeon]MBT4441547.1 cyclopropane fatty acyl phospholipid synthase [archaeon]
MDLKQTTQELLNHADVKINGKRPWDIKVKNPKFYARVLSGGTLALGESYMDGWWDCKHLDQFIDRVLRAKLDTKIKGKMVLSVIKAKLTNQQRKSKAHEIGKKHYDIGNDLYKHMLDKRLTYTCGYWKKAKTLNQAQDEKLDLLCKKLKLKPGLKVLDIGCGWGSFAKFAAEKYKVKVVGITVSQEQVDLAKKRCKGLDVEIRLQDYRDLDEPFDRIVSVGMFEHVGQKNYKTFFKVANSCLKNDGLFLLHTIGGNRSQTSVEPWIDKYIFPNGLLPSAKQVTRAYEGLFILEDWHNFGTYYDKTLMAWHKNFNKNWDKIKRNYDKGFKRMWNYYLLSCAGSFRAHENQLWQIVFSKYGSQVDYESLR